MSYSHLHSAILRGRWLLDKTFAESQMPIIMRMMKGEEVQFGFTSQKKLDGTKQADLPSSIAFGHKAGGNVYGVRPYSDVAGLPDGSIVMYTIAGPVVKRGDYCDYGMIDHANAINRLGNSPNIGGIILNMDSPGGQADGTAMLADVIRSVAANKPVITMIDDGLAASAGYWIGSAANEIYVTQATDQVGSIGVYTTIADFNKHYADYWKLDVKDVYAPQSTDKNGGYREALQGNEEPLKEDLAVMADQFINTVAKNRAGRIKGDAWKTGKMFYPKDAQKHGLIDGQKSFSQIVDRMNVLIKQRSNTSSKSSNNMAFEKALVAAKATEFSVVEGGFLLSEDNLNNVENVLAGAEQTASLVATLNTTVSNLNTQIASLTEAANKAADTKQFTDRIAELEGQVKVLGKQSSGNGTTVSTAKDAATGNSNTSEHKFAGDEWVDSKLAKTQNKTDYSQFRN